jgi:hypothetical protein
MAKPRNYKREYALYQGKPEQIKRRALRNAARRLLMKEGRVRKGDGKDVDHIDRSKRGLLSNARGNLRVVSASFNRSRK